MWVIDYEYRNHLGNVVGQRVGIDGEPDLPLLEAVMSKSYLFIPGRLGLPDLQMQAGVIDLEIDHVWHEFDSVSEADVDGADNVFIVDAEDFNADLLEVEREGWRPEAYWAELTEDQTDATDLSFWGFEPLRPIKRYEVPEARDVAWLSLMPPLPHQDPCRHFLITLEPFFCTVDYETIQWQWQSCSN